MKKLTVAAVIIFVICIPTFLLTTNLMFAINSAALYEYGFDKYDVSDRTGLDEDKLKYTARQMIDYFNSGDEYFETDVFNQREILHLKDVKSLVQLDYCLQIAALSYIALFILIAFTVKRKAAWPYIAKFLVWGSALTIGFLAFLGFWAFTHFDSLFLLFHKISFTNDLWKLSGADNMIRMFPESFFNDAAVFVSMAVIGQALIIGAAAWLFLRLRQKKQTGNTQAGMNGLS